MRFIWANRISIFLRSRRDCWKARLPSGRVEWWQQSTPRAGVANVHAKSGFIWGIPV